MHIVGKFINKSCAKTIDHTNIITKFDCVKDIKCYIPSYILIVSSHLVGYQ